MATIDELISKLEGMKMSDPIVTDVEALAAKVEASVKAKAKAAFAKTVTQFGLRAVYIGLGVAGTLVILHLL